MRLFSKILSTLFHPMLIPTIGLFLIFNVGGHFSYLPIDHKRAVYIIIFLSTCILPLSLIPLFHLTGLIKSIYMEDRKERLFPTLATGGFYLLGYFFLSKISIVPSFIQGFMLATIVAIVITLGITFFWKISMHMIAIGGLTGALLALSFRFGLDIWLVTSAILVISGLIGTSRLYLNAHTPMQVHAGYLLGAMIVFFGIML